MEVLYEDGEVLVVLPARRPRSRRLRVVSVKMDPGLIARLERAAEMLRATRSEVVREAVERLLAEMGV